jgi:hypothetical protein
MFNLPINEVIQLLANLHSKATQVVVRCHIMGIRLLAHSQCRVIQLLVRHHSTLIQLLVRHRKKFIPLPIRHTLVIQLVIVGKKTSDCRNPFVLPNPTAADGSHLYHQL